MMNEVEQFCSINARANEWVQKNPYMFKRIKDNFEQLPSNEIFAILDKNSTIMEKLLHRKCYKTERINKALKYTTPDSILVFIPEIKIYAVFDHKEYLTFISNISSDIDCGKDISYNPQQIILSGFPQKLVFVCKHDDNVIDKIRKYSKTFFNSDITVTQAGAGAVDVMINEHTYNNHADAQKKLREFIAYIEKADNIEDMGVNQKLMKMQKSIDYIATQIPHNHILIDNLDELLKRLPSSGHAPQIILVQQNIVNNVNIENQYVMAECPVSKWVRETPPKNGVLSSDYYKDFINTHPNSPLKLKTFNKLVKTLGFSASKNGGVLRWTAK